MILMDRQIADCRKRYTVCFRRELVRLAFILSSYFFFLRAAFGTKSSATLSHRVEQVDTWVCWFKATRRELFASSNATPEEALCNLSIALSTRCVDACTDSVGLCNVTRDLNMTFVLVAFFLVVGVTGAILEELPLPAGTSSFLLRERSSVLNFFCKQVRLCISTESKKENVRGCSLIREV